MEYNACLIKEIDAAYQINGGSQGISLRKAVIDKTLKGMVDAGMLQATKEGSYELTSNYEALSKELQALVDKVNKMAILQAIYSFNEDIDALFNENETTEKPAEPAEIVGPIEIKKESGEPAIKSRVKEYADDAFFDVVKRLVEKCNTIFSVIKKGLADESLLKEYLQYFDIKKTAKTIAGIESRLLTITAAAVENAKWPLEVLDNSRHDALMVKSEATIRNLFALYFEGSKQSDDTLIPLKKLVSVIERLPEMFVNSYIARLRTRFYYHFTLEKKESRKEHPEIILNYIFDQIRLFQGYLEGLNYKLLFPEVKEKLIGEMMAILKDKYNEDAPELKETTRLFFTFLSEVSSFEAKVYQYFSYKCAEGQSLFYIILKDKINGREVWQIWKEMEAKTAMKLSKQIGEKVSPKMGEELEVLLEYFAKNYSSLPDEIRRQFSACTEEHAFDNIKSAIDQGAGKLIKGKLLDKKIAQSVAEHVLAFDKLIQGIKRQKESIRCVEVQASYTSHMEKLQKSRNNLIESCGKKLGEALYAILEAEFRGGNLAKGKGVLQCAKQVERKFIKKFDNLELSKTIDEILMIILRVFYDKVKLASWMKVLPKFKKGEIKTRLWELADIFQSIITGQKIQSSYESWKELIGAFLEA